VIDPDRSIDIDKGWHGLHFLFTGTADSGDEPGCYLVRGGEDLDDEGQARALRPAQVRRFDEYLSMLNPAELTRRYDPARVAQQLEIYPDAIWARPAPAEDSRKRKPRIIRQSLDDLDAARHRLEVHPQGGGYSPGRKRPIAHGQECSHLLRPAQSFSTSATTANWLIASRAPCKGLDRMSWWHPLGAWQMQSGGSATTRISGR
jgi:hypothetical protein